MSLSKEKRENKLEIMINPKRAKRKSGKSLKKATHRKERRRIKNNVDYQPAYTKYDGWEY